MEIHFFSLAESLVELVKTVFRFHPATQQAIGNKGKFFAQILKKLVIFTTQARTSQCKMSEESRLQSRKKEYEDLLEKQKNLEKELKAWEIKSTQNYEMSLLHKYNEIKDAAQILLGAIANIEGVTVKELHERFQLPLND